MHIKIVLGQLPPRKIAPRTIAPEDNCSLIIKLPPKIVALTQATSRQKVLRVNYEFSTSNKESFYRKLVFKAAN